MSDTSVFPSDAAAYSVGAVVGVAVAGIVLGIAAIVFRRRICPRRDYTAGDTDPQVLDGEPTPAHFNDHEPPVESGRSAAFATEMDDKPFDDPQSPREMGLDDDDGLEGAVVEQAPDARGRRRLSVSVGSVAMAKNAGKRAKDNLKKWKY